MSKSNRLKKIKDQMKDELFEGQAWYAAVSKDDFVFLYNRAERLTRELEYLSECCEYMLNDPEKE